MRDMQLPSAHKGAPDPARVLRIERPASNVYPQACAFVSGVAVWLTPKQARAAAQRLIEFAEAYEGKGVITSPEVIHP